MFVTNPDDDALTNLIGENALQLKADWENTLNELEATLKVLRGSLNYCEEKGFTDLKLVWNFAVSLNILLYDFKLTVYYLSFEKREWSKRFFARCLATIVYEALEDIPQLTGGSFRSALKKFKNAEILLEDLNEVSSSLNQYKQSHVKSFKAIRNISFAHRDKDAETQVEQIVSIDWGKAIDYALAFDPILRNYGTFIQKVMGRVEDYDFNK